jgi:hypothetical protein
MEQVECPTGKTNSHFYLQKISVVVFFFTKSLKVTRLKGTINSLVSSAILLFLYCFKLSLNFFFFEIKPLILTIVIPTV